MTKQDIRNLWCNRLSQSTKEDRLYSYDTTVGRICTDKDNSLFVLFSNHKYSSTTFRHIKEFKASVLNDVCIIDIPVLPVGKTSTLHAQVISRLTENIAITLLVRVRKHSNLTDILNYKKTNLLEYLRRFNLDKQKDVATLIEALEDMPSTAINRKLNKLEKILYIKLLYTFYTQIPNKYLTNKTELLKDLKNVTPT